MEEEASLGRWHSLPAELVDMIFAFAEGDVVSLTVCRFVCKQWRDHIPFPPDAKIFFAFNTASAGQLNILQWAKQNGCPLDSSACAGASLGNQQIGRAHV